MIGDLTVAQNLRLTGADPAKVRHELAEMDLDGLDLDEQVRDIPCPSCGCSTWPGRWPSTRSC